MYFVYILQSQLTLEFYKGQTDDVMARLNRHNAGREKATRHGVPWKLLWQVEKATRADAMELENKLKNLSRDRLIQFIKKYS